MRQQAFLICGPTPRLEEPAEMLVVPAVVPCQRLLTEPIVGLTLTETELRDTVCKYQQDPGVRVSG